MAEARTERLSIRVTPTEKQMATQLAEERGVDVGDIVRMLLRDEYEKKHPKT